MKKTLHDKTTDFQLGREWCDRFEKSDDGETALVLVDDNLADRITGNAHESPTLGSLTLRLMEACYNAATFKDMHKAKRQQYKDVVWEIKGKGKNQLKSIEILRGFLRRYPVQAGYALV